MLMPTPIRNIWYRLTLCRAPGPKDGGAYSHWYCQHHRGHAHRRHRFGKRKHTVPIPGRTHRYRNYIWDEQSQQTKYVPVPIDMASLVAWDSELDIKPRRRP